VVVHAEPGALIYAGLRPGVTRDDFAAACGTGEFEPLLHRFVPNVGDCILIPSGTVHAIGAGVVLAEIQQMSDATFRIHDWGRLGDDGKPRTLHLAEALESTDFRAGPVAPFAAESEPIAGGVREHLARSPFFALGRLRLTGPSPVGTRERFTIVLGLGGSAEITGGGARTSLDFGQTLLLPASLGVCEVIPRGEAVVLTCVVP